MPNNTSLNLEAGYLGVGNTLYVVYSELRTIRDIWNNTDAQALVSALASNTTPATTSASGALNKLEVLNGILMSLNLLAWFENFSASAGNYLSISQNLQNGSSPASQALSGSTEDLGKRLVAVAKEMIDLYGACLQLDKVYSLADFGSVLALMLTKVVLGCNTIGQKMANGATLVQNFVTIFSGAGAGQSDFYGIVVSWAQGL